MIYLSRGMAVKPETEEPFRISRWGKIYALGPNMAGLWQKGTTAPAKASHREEASVRKLEEMGLVVTTEEAGNLASFRLLLDCVLCPSGKHPPLLFGRDRRVWTWLTQAGLRLTVSELIRLEEQNVAPAPELLGTHGRQALTEEIYCNTNIFDGILETEMEHSPARDVTVGSILRLVRSRRLLLI